MPLDVLFKAEASTAERVWKQKLQLLVVLRMFGANAFGSVCRHRVTLDWLGVLRLKSAHVMVQGQIMIVSDREGQTIPHGSASNTFLIILGDALPFLIMRVRLGILRDASAPILLRPRAAVQRIVLQECAAECNIVWMFRAVVVGKSASSCKALLFGLCLCFGVGNILH